MGHKPLILALSFLVASPCALLSQGKAGAKPTGADKRISVTVERVERADVFPERLKAPGQQYLPPDPGNDYVLVHLSVVSKKDLNVGVMEFSVSPPNGPRLIDDQGEDHWALMVHYNVTRGYEPLGEGGLVVFQMPRQAAPVQLQFVYAYRDGVERPGEIQYARIDIDLSRARQAAMVLH